MGAWDWEREGADLLVDGEDGSRQLSGQPEDEGSGLSSSWLQLHIGGGGAIKMGLLMVGGGGGGMGTDIVDVSWRTHIILVMVWVMGYMAH